MHQRTVEDQGTDKPTHAFPAPQPHGIKLTQGSCVAAAS